jgi:CRISPR/Cas system-associated exonuclease Cas4 (RecB family)
MAYERNPAYKPGQKEAYKISRSKIDLFVECPRCFWLDGRLKISRPSLPGFTLNIAVDELLKKEFDALRLKGEQHAIQIEYGIDAKPAKHDQLSVWRQNFKGVQYTYEPANFIVTGAIDDLWINSKGEYIVLDYKATSRAEQVTELGDKPWHDAYRRQLAVYRWLLVNNGLKVSDTGYWVYANGIKSGAGFDKKLEFELTLIAEKIDDKWVEPALKNIKSCLESDIPSASKNCEYCGYLKQQADAFKKK